MHKKYIDESKKEPNCNSLLVIAQGTKFSWKDAPIGEKIDIEYIRQEIDNRYSYYYVRMDNGLFAPFFAFVIFLLLKATFLRQEPLIYAGIILIIAIIVGFLMLMYIPVIFKEIDDIEYYLVSLLNGETEKTTEDAKPEKPPDKNGSPQEN